MTLGQNDRAFFVLQMILSVRLKLVLNIRTHYSRKPNELLTTKNLSKIALQSSSSSSQSVKFNSVHTHKIVEKFTSTYTQHNMSY